MNAIQYRGSKNVVHHRLKQCRLKCGMSQATLAQLMQSHDANINQQMISSIEKNCRTVTDYEVACFAHVLGVTPQWLLSGCDAPLPKLHFWES